MAASDAFYRPQATLNKIFAATSALMLVTVVWMFADDFNRGYKKDQRAFRSVEEELNKRAVLAQAPDEEAAKKIAESEAQVVASRTQVARLKRLVDDATRDVAPKRATLEVKLREIKADFDSRTSYFNLAEEKFGPDHPETQRFKAEAEAKWAELEKRRPDLEAMDQQIVAERKLPRDLDGQSVSLDQAEKHLKDLEADHKKLTAEFDRYLKMTAAKRWKWSDSFRALPVLDAFASPVKINQTFHDDLPIDYGGFKYVTRYDRCTTCHLGIDKANYDRATLTRLTLDPGNDAELQTTVADARRALELRQEVNKDKSQDVNVLAARNLEPQKVGLSASQVSAFAAHPRLDLFVGAETPHPAEKFGCTICHSGQGSATSFNDAAHTPNDVPTRELWVHDKGWQAVHTGDWEFPMHPKRFVESSCLKCHHQVESLIHDGNRNEADTLVKGYNLVRELGCFGCHEIAGTKSGRAVGPDLRLESDPPLESLPPAEQAKRLADTANPPGLQRKVGPSLNRIAEKTTPEWAMKWLKAPRAFRPDTKMPHFYLQANNVASALPDDQKKFPDVEIRAVTQYLFGESRKRVEAINAAAAKVKELESKLHSAELPSDEREKITAELSAARAVVTAPGNDVLLGGEKLASEDKATRDEKAKFGRNLFATKGCVACHKHSELETAGPDVEIVDPVTKQNVVQKQPPMVGESDFGPELSGLAIKLQGEMGRAWLIQWLLDPTVHSPRTLMPNVHLTKDEAEKIAAWLLSQSGKAPAEWDTVSVDDVDRETVEAMLRMYLRKAGMTTRETEALIKQGSKEAVAMRPADADEHLLAGSPSLEHQLTYIGKKAIGNLGCYGCHNIPGFEHAKPIGVGLNDWGKKDVDRIAFEDGDRYVRERFHTVELRDDPENPSLPAKQWTPGDGNDKPLEQFAPYMTDKQPPYEQFFAEMLPHGHHRKREGFLHLKLMSPRTFDYNRVREWNDRARMPQFKFARTHPNEGESPEAYRIRADKEEAVAREAVMTFVLGLVAEPIPMKFINQPSGDRADVVKGRQVIEKYNCASCHMIRPGQYELSLSADKITLPDGTKVTNKAAVLKALMFAHSKYVANEQSKDHPFPEHVAWGPVKQPSADKIIVRGLLTINEIDEDQNQGPSLRPTQAVGFTDAEGKKQVIPASPTTGIPFVAAAMHEQAAPLGGSWGLRLKAFLSLVDSKLYGDEQPINKVDDVGKAADGYAAMPPTLHYEGERVQPDWLYQFLLNPSRLRKIPPLQMPKFSLSPAEAMALVNYFSAVNRMDNPGLGLTSPYVKIPQRDEAYLLGKTKEYVARLKANNLFDDRVKEMKPAWEQAAKEQLTAAEFRLAAMKAAKDDAKAADAQKEVDSLRRQIDTGEFPEQKARWETHYAYVADAWKMVTYPGNLCLTCHQVGPAIPSEYRAPNLQLAADRLRPEWTARWIAFPQRLLPYTSLMQPQYTPEEAKKHYQDDRVFIGDATQQIEATRDLLFLFPMVQDSPAIKFRIGPAAFAPAPEKK